MATVGLPPAQGRWGLEAVCTGSRKRMKRKELDIDITHEWQLMTLLQETVREKGSSGAARVLEIDRRTVTACMKKGRMSWRVREALERRCRRASGQRRSVSTDATRSWRHSR